MGVAHTTPVNVELSGPEDGAPRASPGGPSGAVRRARALIRQLRSKVRALERRDLPPAKTERLERFIDQAYAGAGNAARSWRAHIRFVLHRRFENIAKGWAPPASPVPTYDFLEGSAGMDRRIAQAVVQEFDKKHGADLDVGLTIATVLAWRTGRSDRIERLCILCDSAGLFAAGLSLEKQKDQIRKSPKRRA